MAKERAVMVKVVSCERTEELRVETKRQEGRTGAYIYRDIKWRTGAQQRI